MAKQCCSYFLRALTQVWIDNAEVTIDLSKLKYLNSLSTTLPEVDCLDVINCPSESIDSTLLPLLFLNPPTPSPSMVSIEGGGGIGVEACWYGEFFLRFVSSSWSSP